MAEPPEIVVEVVGWDRIDSLPELLLFHSTAEGSFGGSVDFFGKPAIFWLEGWGAFMRFHRGDDEAPTQEVPVGKVPELPGPIIRRRLGSNGLVRFRRGAIFRIASNLRRVARPRRGAEGGVRSGNG